MFSKLIRFCIFCAYTLLSFNLFANQLPDKSGEIIATVLSKDIFHHQVKPNINTAEQQRKTLTAKQFNKWVLYSSATRLFDIVTHPLMDIYAKKHNFVPTTKDVVAFINKQKGDSTNITNGQINFLRPILISRRVAKSLHSKYGGSVCISSFGHVIPIEAWSIYLKQQYKTGSFNIIDPKINTAFWDYVNSEKWDGTLTEKEARQMFVEEDYL